MSTEPDDLPTTDDDTEPVTLVVDDIYLGHTAPTAGED